MPDLRKLYSFETIEALNQFSPYTVDTLTDVLDLRCEYDIPRYFDLTQIRTEPLKGEPIFWERRLLLEQLKVRNEVEELANFNFFYNKRDYNTPRDETIATELKNKILSM